MLSSRRWCTFVALLSSVMARPGLAGLTQQVDRPFPDPASFMRQVREAVRLDYELQSGFTYVEERRDVRISRLGKVDVGPLRTFQVFPSSRPGRTYKRLIAVDGRPIGPAELARRDREHRKLLAEMDEREQQESAEDRAKRLKKQREEMAERDSVLDDALAVFEARFESRDRIDGQAVFVIGLSPRQHARVTTREGRWMKEFEGRVWIAEAGHQIVRLDLRAREDVTIGWGILGRVHEGSRFTFARRWFDGAWLPAKVVFDARGRTLLFRAFDIDLITTFSEYRRIG